MRKAILLAVLTVELAVPLSADQERHQSYISYDDGGTVVKSGEDGRSIEAQRNLPVYPGDEVVTARRGRAEVHLSDGNIVGIDRATSLRFRSILDSYEGDSNETVAELKYGKVAVQRTDLGRDHIRLDTDNASYVANYEAIYSVETDSRGADRVIVFVGSIEVRTPSRSSRLRAGESANVDDRGVFDLVGDQRSSADDFERWFLKRAERSGTYTSRYMDRRLSYWNDDLDDHGRWVMVAGIGWSWRPFVSVGWRPYHNGYWYHRNNCLTWVSYDPWGWGTYHYGRWAFDPGYGWVWVPGYGYSPAWVYWMYGRNNLVGWAPSGYWDCHRGYYDWAYRPYRNSGIRVGAGFYGRIRLNDVDLRPWTFVDGTTLISTRADRAALTVDAVRSRLGRGGSGADFGTISSAPARFTREELRDPAESIRRRSLNGDRGIEAGTPADLTQYFRREPEVASGVRDRIVRSRGGSPAAGAATVPSTGRNVGGGNAIVGGGSGAERGGGTEERINRGGSSGDSRPPVRVIGEEPASSGGWRNRGNLGGGSGDSTPAGVDRPRDSSPAPSAPDATPSRDAWRSRGRGGDAPAATAPATGGATDTPEARGGSDVPRRVIDRIGGARIHPRDPDNGSAPAARAPAPERSGGDRGSDRARDRGTDRSSGGDRGSSTRDRSGDSGSRSGGSQAAPPPPPPRDNGGNRENSGNRESGGRIKRDQ